MRPREIGVRWTVGNVSNAGFKALKLSISSARNLFGRRARYAVCVNSVSIETARLATGPVPCEVQWLQSDALLPDWLNRYVDGAMAEGVAWKLAPVRVFKDRHEIALDNDVILWKRPGAMKQWLDSDDPNACLLAEDVQRCLGQFAPLCDPRSINSGIRGLPPGFDLEKRLQQVLDGHRIALRSELDEQGLQAAALSKGKLFLVSTDDVSICSPFPMHQNSLGRCGAHFVGLNQKQLPWKLEGRKANEVIHARWERFVDEIQNRIWSSELCMP